MQKPFPLHRQRFPWRTGNRFQLLVDGENYFPAMLAAMAAAQRFILLEMYLLTSGMVADRFVTACEAATDRGVQVFVLADDYGARGLGTADRRRLEAAGVHLALYNRLHYGKWRRNLWRDHRKLLVVDDQVAFTGGSGITDDFAPPAPLPWHDVMLAIHGPCVADWQQAFAQVWKHTRHGKRQPLYFAPTAKVRSAATGRQPRIFERFAKITQPKCAGRGGKVSPAPQQDDSPAAAPGLTDHKSREVSGWGRVVLNDPTRMEIKKSLILRLRGARQRVWIASAYFIPSWKVRRALYQAARRGLDVRLLLPGPYTDHPSVRHAARRYYKKLLAAGVRIFEYQPRFIHAKLLLVDDWVSIGSSNIDRWNFRWNLEANQEAHSPQLTAELLDLFATDFAASQEIMAGTWHHRPWYQRLLERFWGTLELWLERFSQGKP